MSRQVRTLTVATACVLSTAALHSAAGGALPAFGLLVAAVTAFGLSTALTQRRFALPVVVAGMLGCQALMHVVLSATGSHGSHGAGLVPSSSMIGAHLVAAVVTALVVCRLDDLVECWLSFWRALRTPLPSTALPSPDRGPQAPWRPIHAIAPSVHLTVVRRRGPPSS